MMRDNIGRFHTWDIAGLVGFSGLSLLNLRLAATNGTNWLVWPGVIYALFLWFFAHRVLNSPWDSEVPMPLRRRHKGDEFWNLCLSMGVMGFYNAMIASDTWKPGILGVFTLYPICATLVLLIHYTERMDLGGSYRRATSGNRNPQARGTPVTAGTFNRALGAGSGSGEGPGLTPEGLPVVREEVPILAARWSVLRWRDGRWNLGALNDNFGTFDIDADAVCHRDYLHDKGHAAPDPTCNCGFYAVASDRLANHMNMIPGIGAHVGLGVELSGTVVEHEHGYRAGHQRILEMYTPTCGFHACHREVIGLLEVKSTVVPDHRFTSGWLCAHHQAAMLKATHSLTTKHQYTPVAIDVVLGQIGVPVVAPPPGYPGAVA